MKQQRIEQDGWTPTTVDALSRNGLNPLQDIADAHNAALAADRKPLVDALNDIRRKAVAEYGVRDITRQLGEIATDALAQCKQP